jgi:hypothetical protein
MTNGNGGTDELAVKAAVEHHVASYQRVVSERDDLQRQNDKKDQLLTVAKIEVEQLRSELAVERSRTQSYQTERDDAVIHAATLVEALNHIKAVIQRHAPGDAH